MHEHVDEVIPEGVHPAERVVESQGEPRQRDPVPHEGRREHPPEVAQPSPRKSVLLVKFASSSQFTKPAFERWEERDKSGGDDEKKQHGTRPRRH